MRREEKSRRERDREREGLHAVCRGGNGEVNGMATNHLQCRRCRRRRRSSQEEKVANHYQIIRSSPEMPRILSIYNSPLKEKAVPSFATYDV